FQAEDGIRDFHVTGVQTCALPIFCWVANVSVFHDRNSTIATSTINTPSSWPEAIPRHHARDALPNASRRVNGSATSLMLPVLVALQWPAVMPGRRRTP